MSEEIFEKVCTKCKGDPQPIDNFYRKKKGSKARSSICKTCAKASVAAWNIANPGRALERVNNWTKEHPAQVAANKKRWKQTSGYDSSERNRQLTRERRARQRREAIETMGSKCSCCGNPIFDFLCFDHIGGWGAEHRKVVSQTNMPLWLKKHSYPKGDGTVCEACGEIHKGVRLLCYNCNMSIAADPDGICAHQRTEPIDYSRFSERSRYERQWRLKLRDEVFTEYGGKCQCPGCDETNFAFLSVEHVGGWGKDHRKQLAPGTPMNQWLKKNGFPREGFALSCFNCNMSAGKSEDGKCPHEVSSVAIAA